MPRKQQVTIDGRELAISNLDKVFFSETGFTKGQVIGFYSDIAETILPHLRDRPLTLKRYPDGVEGEHFYEKNAPVHTPDWVKTFPVPRSEGGGEINYVLCNDRPTLVWVTNLGDIEKHVLLARAPELNRPTSIVFDLDPGEGADLLGCGRVALRLRKTLEALGLECLVKVSGSKGLHLTVPLNSEVTYEMTQPFARAIAELVEQETPDQVVSVMARTRRRGKVLIDWSQNSDFKTTVCVYAMRARPGPPHVSMPITWEELSGAVKRGRTESLYFTPPEALKRLDRVGDLFEPAISLSQTLPRAFSEALAAGPPRRLARWPRNQSKKSSGRLQEYVAKRDLTRTPEPGAGTAAPKKAAKNTHRFVIQKHAASHLHYDWRLEMEGVLRSWAVPKGPPTQPRETRLAMHVEDHPLEYADFEGTIPSGNYGAGTVMIWDHGEYEDQTGNPVAAFYAGKLHLHMRGEKLKGEWILVKDRREEDSNKWLLIKAGPAVGISRKADDTSVVSGRSMRQIAAANDAQWESDRPASSAGRKPRRVSPRVSAKKTSPRYIEPMLCKSVAALPDDEEWSFEIKLDGYRCIAVKQGAKVELFSRNEKKLNDRFPRVVTALSGVHGDFVLDGEVVALDRSGKPSFQLLQNNQSTKLPVFFYAFDLLHRDGSDLFGEPLENRREQLDNLLESSRDPIRLSPLLEVPAAEILKAVRQLGLEGVIAKRKASLYEPGKRSGAWVKHRTNQEQEFVIGGYVPSARTFESLIVGVYEQKSLLFVAKVKNGFSPRVRGEIFPALKSLQTDTCPFTNLPETKRSRWGQALTAEKMKECRWVKPVLVCQIAFVEWTEGGDLRHATFLAMRDDKDAREVTREQH